MPRTLIATCTVNTAPTLSTAAFTLPAVLENVTSPTVTASALLADAGWNDADGKTVPSGIAIIGAAGPGTWQWMNGSTWTALPTTLSNTLALLLPSTAQLRFVPADALPVNTNGTATLTFLAWDQTQGSAGKTFAISATGAATAFSSPQPPRWPRCRSLSSTTRQPGRPAPAPRSRRSWHTPFCSIRRRSPPGDAVASVFGSVFGDADPNTTVGIAVVGLTGTADGIWQYNLGSGWSNFPASVGAASNGTALLLSGNDRIRFRPSKPFSGTVSLTVRAWDGSTGTDGGTILLSKLSTGGANAFSATTLIATCAVNTAPTLTTPAIPLAAVNENVTGPTATVKSLLTAAGWSDADGLTVSSGIAIIGTAGPGTWKWLNGATWTALPTTLSSAMAFLLPSTASLEFVPADNLPANTNGTATLTFRAWDQTQGSAGATFAIGATGGDTAFSVASATVSMPINFVNHAPAWLSGASAAFHAVLAYSASSNPTPNPAGDAVSNVFGAAFSDADSGTTTGIAIVGLTGTTDGTWQSNTGGGWTNFPAAVGASSNGAALLLSGGDLIRFVPNKPFAGPVSLTVRAWDGSTGTDGGTILLSTTQHRRRQCLQRHDPGRRLCRE